MNAQIKLIISYMLINIFYYAANAGLGVFGNLYMTNRGLGEGAIGLVFSLASLLTLVFQVIISRKLEDSKGKSIQKSLNTLALISIGLILIIIPVDLKLTTTLLFIMIWALNIAIVPLLSALVVEYRDKGYTLNFSAVRAFGSGFYSMTSVILGQFFFGYSSEWLMVFVLVFNLGIIASSIQLPRENLSSATNLDPIRSDPNDDQNIKLVKRFPWILIGIFFFMIMHSVSTSFMLQILDNVGGNEANLGIAIGLSSGVEFPILLLYKPLAKRFGHRRLLFVSGIGFTIKAIFLLFASSIITIYLAQVLQIFGFGLYVSSIMEYSNEIMKTKQAVKAQFDVSIYSTAGGVVGNLLGGIILESIGVNYMLFFGTISTIIGLICFIKGMGKLDTIRSKLNKYPCP